MRKPNQFQTIKQNCDLKLKSKNLIYKMLEFTKALILLEFMAVSAVHGYGRGAPVGQCDNMTPGHYGADIRTADGTEPIHIIAAKQHYSAGEEIEVEIKTKPGTAGTAGTTFKGFMLQARTSSGTRVGTFSVMEGDNLQLLDCENVPGTSVTHTNLLGTTTGIKATWRAPGESEGNVTLLATVVKTRLDVYTGVKSAALYFKEQPLSSGGESGHDGSSNGNGTDGNISCNGTVCHQGSNTNCNGTTCNISGNSTTGNDSSSDGSGNDGGGGGNGAHVLCLSLPCCLLVVVALGLV